MAKPVANTLPHTTTAFLDRGSRFEGTLTFQGSVRIDGVFKGNIANGNHLVLGEKAEVEGAISVEEIIVSGHFQGTITAARRISLLAAARVEAVLAAPQVGIEEGAVFNGEIHMTKESSAVVQQIKGTGPTDADLMLEGIKKTVTTR